MMTDGHAQALEMPLAGPSLALKKGYSPTQGRGEVGAYTGRKVGLQAATQAKKP